MSCKIEINDVLHTSCNVDFNKQGILDTILIYSLQSIVSPIFYRCNFFILKPRTPLCSTTEKLGEARSFRTIQNPLPENPLLLLEVRYWICSINIG